MGVDDLSETNEQKMNELLSLMRSVVPDPEGMNDAGRIGFVYKYDYDPAETYEKLDVVLFGPSLWTPKQDTTGNPPPDQSQSGQENVRENEFWTMFLPGAPGSDYIKKTDISKAPTETESGKPGINFPDGKTIQIGEDGMLVGTPLDFTGTLKELQDAITSGEVKDGMTGYVSGTGVDGEDENHPNNMLFDFDNFLSTISSNAPQNRAVTAAINELRNAVESINQLRATLEAYGLAKITESTTVTEADSGLVLGAKEKNPNFEGGLANLIKKIEPNFYFAKPSDNIANISFFEVSLAKIGKVGMCGFNINNGPNPIPDGTEIFEFPDGFKPGQMVYRWVPCLRNNSAEGISQLFVANGKINMADNGKISYGISGSFWYKII